MAAMLRVVIVMLLAATTAHADEPTDRTRALDLGLTVGMGGAYLVAEFGFNAELSPTTCRWCEPTGFDVPMRDALKWGDTGAANTISNLTGYVLAPLATAGGLVLAGGRSGWRRHYDDAVPVIQAAIFASLLQHVTKLGGGRQRPYAHFAPPGTLTPSEEDNVSFWSGHTSLDFALAVSAGTIADARGYRYAPVIWATGLTLAGVTGYLRVAADRHYATDVLMGAAVGTLVGYAWPRLVHRHIWRGVEVVPTGTGLAAIGAF